MKVISKILDSIQKVLGEQEYHADKKYRPITYCKTTFIDDGVLLYSSLTRELLLLSYDEYKDFTNNKTNEFLVKHWFMVPNDIDDSTLLYLFDRTYKTRFPRNKYGKFNLCTIITTTDCNARCPYCYERHGKFIKRTMSEKISKDVVNFILKNNTAKDIRLDWLGGEPLLNHRSIDIICEELKKQKICFTSNLTTNGFEITPQIIDKAKNLWNLKSIQITLDGTEKNYNKIKNYIVSSKNPYQVVLSNIEQILNTEIRLSIRLNLSSENVDDLIELIDQLIQRFPNTNKYLIYVCLLEEETHIADKNEMEKNIENWTKISEKLWNLGFQQKLLEEDWPVNKCIADNDNCHVISPIGNLYRCEEIESEDIVGNIYDGIINNKIVEKWKQTNKSDICHTCPINPVCYNLLHCNSDLQCNKLTQTIDISSRKYAMKFEYEKFIRMGCR